MPDPTSRPPLALAPMVRLLNDHRVEWVLTGSAVLALYGADLEPADLDVTPALDPANLERLAGALRAAEAIPAYTPGWRDDFTLETCRAWRPEPATEEQLEWLYVTRLGMLDVPMRMCGTYDELLPGATTMDIDGTPVSVCDPRQVLARVTRLTSPKHQERALLYAGLALP
ncbi:hypothetical protein JIG36_38460 [Actinoplanes sp. LDG1-06]|uniref:Nucleotidyltransferase family protein n=1 Tax=Paractinoplanes ovalisporus TaxID=2810368 RepID=A0ABS2ANG5_9ACTN|nr:hypothetical protein [Actinoplanes ovalisporus]MBM2621403.1 hypothetical protein [Actinoplanes ovalisporus]